MVDLVANAALIARALLGRADPHFSDSKHLRYGPEGKLQVNVLTGRFYDMEADEGGDMAELVKRVKRFENGQAEAWIDAVVERERKRAPPIDQPLPELEDDALRDMVAERDVIGSLLLRPDRYELLMEHITADQFGEPLHGDVFTTIAQLIERDEKVLLTSVINSIGGDDGEDVVPGFRIAEYLARLMADAAPKFETRARDRCNRINELYEARLRSIEDYEKQADREMAAAKARFKLRPFNEVTLTQFAPSLVRGILPASGLCIIWGPPKCGKSFWTFDICMHVALGWQYRGRPVKQGPVVYFLLEGESGYGARVQAFRNRFLKDHNGDIPFYDTITRLDLVKDHVQMINDIRAQLGDMKPVVVTIDTLNRSLHGSENDDRDMGAYIKAADAIREAFDCLVIIVHHCGVGGERPRGHTSLTGAVDAQLACKRDEQKNVVVTIEWLKDGEDGGKLTSRLDVVVVGQEPDGHDIKSCVVVDEEGSGASPAGYKPTAGQLLLLKAIVSATDSYGVPAGTVPGLRDLPRSVTKVVDLAYVKTVYAQNAGTNIGEISDMEARDKAISKAVTAASNPLKAAGVVGSLIVGANMFIWWTGKPVQHFGPQINAATRYDDGEPVPDKLDF